MSRYPPEASSGQGHGAQVESRHIPCGRRREEITPWLDARCIVHGRACCEQNQAGKGNRESCYNECIASVVSHAQDHLGPQSRTHYTAPRLSNSESSLSQMRLLVTFVPFPWVVPKFLMPIPDP